MPTIIQLGKLGDILNILPLAYHDAGVGKPWGIMVSKEFSTLLEGCSYVQQTVFDGPHFEIEKAYQQAAAYSQNVVVTQVNGPKDAVLKYCYEPAGMKGAVTTSFQKEQWRIARRLGEWQFNYPLVFDRRNPEREQDLVESFGLPSGKKAKPLMLVSVKGQSSPVNFGKLLLGLLQLKFSKDYEIKEVPQADRLYDLLAIYEKAAILVATDSAPLHLARATPTLPVVAWVNDKPTLWNGSAMQPQHIFYGRYGDWNERAIEMLDVIADARRHQTRPASAAQILLIQNQYDDLNGHTPSDFLRLPLRSGACGRDSLQLQGETKRLPFLRDCIKLGLQRCEPHQWICVARPGLDFKRNIGATLRQHEACYAYRIQDDAFVPVLDLFCARKSWWGKFFGEVGNFIFGTDHYWPQAIWCMFKKHGAADVTGAVTRQSKPPAPRELEPPRLAHNRNLCTISTNYFKIHSRYPRVSDQVELLPLDLSKLMPHGYNPSILEHGGKILMAYRFHQGTPATQLAYVTFDDQWRVMVHQTLEGVKGQSREDPKLFRHNGKIYFSFVQSTFPNAPFKSVVQYAEFGRAESRLEPVTPPLPGNDWTTMQKNYVCFDGCSRLYCLYQCQPTQKIYLLGGPDPAPCSELPGPKWSYGHIKGGTAPVDYDGKWLRFFHSTLDNELDPLARRRYYVGAYLMNPDSFEVLRVSKKPIIYGSEVCEAKPKDCHHFKKNVVFPGSAIVKDGAFLVPLGINDCQVVVAKIQENQLNL